MLVLQYDVHPFVGISFGPITFIICVLGGLGNMIGGFIAAFILSIIISVGGLYSEIEWGYVLAFVFFIVMMFIRPQVYWGKNDDKNYSFYNWSSTLDCTFIAPQYPLHLLIMILIWSLVYTAWSLMGRFGLVSLGHGAFMSIGAYVTALLWNYGGISPWIGIPAAMITAAIMAFLVAYPCFQFKIGDITLLW